MNDIENKTNFRIRRIQAIHNDQTAVLYLPHDFTSVLKIAKGDYVKCTINDSKQLIVEKAFFDSQNSINDNRNSTVKEAQI